MNKANDIKRELVKRWQHKEVETAFLMQEV